MKRLLFLLLIGGIISLCGCGVTIEMSRGRDATLTVPEDRQELPKPTTLASFKLVHPLPEVPETIMVYKTLDPKISQQDIPALMKVFDLGGRIVDRERQFVVRDQDRVLEVFKQPGTGYLRFSDDSKLGIEKQAKSLPSEDEAIDKAKEFLSVNGLLPENTFLAGVGYYEFRKYDSEGEMITQGESALAVTFGFEVEGMKVEGPGAKASVVFGEESEIIGASRIWREIDPDREMEVITPEEAFARFKQRWPREAEPEQLEQADIRTEVNIKEVYVTYYARPGCVPQSHIEPVYIFKGDYQISGRIGEREIRGGDYFEIIIPAIPKE